MQEVESYFVDMGRKCNTRLLEKKVSNLHTWDGSIRTAGTSHQGAWFEVMRLLIGFGRHRALYFCISTRGSPQLS